MIRVKRGVKEDLPTLYPGEPGMCLDTGEFYVGGNHGNVRVNNYLTPEAYGARGDGTTDDTVAIQAAVDTLTAGGACVLTPGKTYKTNTIYIPYDNIWFGCIGGQATLSIASSTCYGILVHGGTITAANRTLAYFNATYSVSDYNTSRRSGVTIENIKTTAYTTTKNTSIAMMWADDCRIINCETEESDGNGYDIRHCRRPIVYGCKSTSPAAYNMFFFQCSRALVERNTISGGTLGINFKHNYNNEPCQHIARANVISGIVAGPCFSGGYNYTTPGTQPYYIAGCEIVDGVIIEDNVLVGGGTTAPNIWVNGYADHWVIRGNRFDGNGVTSSYRPLYISGLCDWYSNGNLGTVGQDHIVEHNTFTNMLIDQIADVGGSCRILNNNIDCNFKHVASESDQILSSAIDIELSGNVINQIGLAVQDDSGLFIGTTNFRSAIVTNNRMVVTPVTRVAGTWVQFVSSAASFSYVCGNYIKISRGAAEHDVTKAITINGSSSVVRDNYIGVDSYGTDGTDGTTVGVRVGTSATDGQHVVESNTIENLGTSSASTGLEITQITNIGVNKFLGTWTASITDTSGLGTIRSNDERIFGTEAQLPSYRIETTDTNIGVALQAYANGGWVGTTTDDRMEFGANNSTKMTILANGRLGVGTVAPQDKLDVTEAGTDQTCYARVQNAYDKGLGVILIRSKSGGSYNSTWYVYVPGTSTQLRLYNGADKVAFDSDGNVGLGGQVTFGTSATNSIAHKSGTAPAGNLTDAYQLYSADITAGNAAPHFRTEAGDIVKLYKQVLAADLKENYTTGDLDSEAEVIAAVNATNAKINALITAIQGTGILASS